MLKVEYELVCSDDTPENIHTILAYSFNPILFNLAERVGIFNRSTPARALYEWINEEDGARVELIHMYDNKTLEELYVEFLFNLRDSFISNKIDLNTFRRHVANLIALAFYKNMSIVNDLLRLLSALGCTMYILPRQIARGEDVSRLLDNVKAFARIKPEDLVVIEILIATRKKEIPRYPFIIRVSSPHISEMKTMEYTVTTDEYGRALVPVPKYSVVEIIAPNKIAEVYYEIAGVPEGSSKQIVKNRAVKFVISNRGMRLVMIIKRLTWVNYIIFATIIIFLLTLTLLFLT